MLAKWLAVITEKDIEDKTIIKNICEEQEEIGMAVSELVRLSEDKITRQAYQRRQDEILLQHLKDRKMTELENEIARKDAALADKDAALADKDAALADKDAALADKDAALADKDTENELLKRQLDELRSQLDENYR